MSGLDTVGRVLTRAGVAYGAACEHDDAYGESFPGRVRGRGRGLGADGQMFSERVKAEAAGLPNTQVIVRDTGASFALSSRTVLTGVRE